MTPPPVYEAKRSGRQYGKKGDGTSTVMNAIRSLSPGDTCVVGGCSPQSVRVVTSTLNTWDQSLKLYTKITEAGVVIGRHPSPAPPPIASTKDEKIVIGLALVVVLGIIGMFIASYFSGGGA